MTPPQTRGQKARGITDETPIVTVPVASAAAASSSRFASPPVGTVEVGSWLEGKYKAEDVWQFALERNIKFPDNFYQVNDKSKKTSKATKTAMIPIIVAYYQNRTGKTVAQGAAASDPVAQVIQQMETAVRVEEAVKEAGEAAASNDAAAVGAAMEDAPRAAIPDMAAAVAENAPSLEAAKDILNDVHARASPRVREALEVAADAAKQSEPEASGGWGFGRLRSGLRRLVGRASPPKAVTPAVVQRIASPPGRAFTKLTVENLRLYAEQRDINLSTLVSGSGAKGSVIKADIVKFITEKRALQDVAAMEIAAFNNDPLNVAYLINRAPMDQVAILSTTVVTSAESPEKAAALLNFARAATTPDRAMRISETVQVANAAADVANEIPVFRGSPSQQAQQQTAFMQGQGMLKGIGSLVGKGAAAVGNVLGSMVRARADEAMEEAVAHATNSPVTVSQAANIQEAHSSMVTQELENASRPENVPVLDAMSGTNVSAVVGTPVATAVVVTAESAGSQPVVPAESVLNTVSSSSEIRELSQPADTLPPALLVIPTSQIPVTDVPVTATNTSAEADTDKPVSQPQTGILGNIFGGIGRGVRSVVNAAAAAVLPTTFAPINSEQQVGNTMSDNIDRQSEHVASASPRPANPGTLAAEAAPMGPSAVIADASIAVNPAFATRGSAPRRGSAPGSIPVPVVSASGIAVGNSPAKQAQQHAIEVAMLDNAQLPTGEVLKVVAGSNNELPASLSPPKEGDVIRIIAVDQELPRNITVINRQLLRDIKNWLRSGPNAYKSPKKRAAPKKKSAKKTSAKKTSAKKKSTKKVTKKVSRKKSTKKSTKKVSRKKSTKKATKKSAKKTTRK